MCAVPCAMSVEMLKDLYECYEMREIQSSWMKFLKEVYHNDEYYHNYDDHYYCYECHESGNNETILMILYPPQV